MASNSVATTPRSRRGRASGVRTPLGTPRRSQRHTPKPVTTPIREDVLEEGDNYVIKATNAPVPVRVQEVLRTDLTVNVKLDPSGWAMLLGANNRLLIWRYRTNLVSTKCYDLSMPSPGDGWSLSLLTFTSSTSDERVSLLGCSVKGNLFWWSDILQSSVVTLQGSVEVGGGVVFSVNPVWDAYEVDKCLVTSSNTSMWIINIAEGALSVQSLSQPEGMLSGLGRRVTSMFFRSTVSTNMAEARRVLTHLTSQQEVVAFLLTSANVQRWNVSRPSDQLLVDAPVLDLIKDSVLVNGWVEPTCAPSVSLLDLQVAHDNLALLFAVSDATGPAELGIAIFPLYCGFSSADLKKLIRLNQTVSTSDSSMLTSFSLHSSSGMCLLALVSKAGLSLINVEEDTSQVSTIPFSQSDMIVGVGHQEDQLLVFTRSHGVVNVTSCVELTSRGKGKKKAGTSSRPQEKTAHQMDTGIQGGGRTTLHHLVSSEATAEAAERLQEAFSLYLDGNIARAISLCEEKFPLSATSRGGVNTLGDMATVHYSQLILDDPPPPVDPSDPSSKGPGGPGGQGSMIFIYRLQQKIEAHAKFLKFLDEVGLMERLTCVPHGNVTTPTRTTPTWQVLQEHAELLQAALNIRKIHDQFVDGVIGVVLQGRSIPPTMSHNDVFYTSVSSLYQFFPALIKYQNTRMAAIDKASDKVKVLVSGASVLEAVLHSVVFYRHSRATALQDSQVRLPPQPPWTSSEGSSGISTIIMSQLDLVVEIGVTHAEGQDLHSLWNYVASLMDILFEGYTSLISCLNDDDKIVEAKVQFVAQRKKYLTVLLQHGQLRSVTDLAERYHDFRILITLCQDSGNYSKLKDYVLKFSEQGFSDFLFKMYLDEGKLEQLLSFSNDFPSELTVFLESHPHLAWLHHLATQDYSAAYKTLADLAHHESKYVGRKKTLLSLSKLSLLASTPSDANTAAEEELNTLLHHIHMQEDVLTKEIKDTGSDSNLEPPLSPMDIVKLYVGADRLHCEVDHFVQVFDYLIFCSKSMHKDVLEPLFLFTCSQAIFKDNWKELSIEEPIKVLKKTFFFQMVEQLIKKNLDVLELLPDLTSLVSYPSIKEAGLSRSHSFNYLMKTGYEHVEKAYGRTRS